MSQIIKFNNTFPVAALQLLQPTERRMMEFSQPSEDNPRIEDMNAHQILSLCQNILLKKSIRLGQKEHTKEDTAILIGELNSDLFKFPRMTGKEIYQAVENGCDGMYKPTPESPVIFSPSAFVQWVRAYIEQKRPISQKLYEVSQSLPSDRPSTNPYDSLAYGWNVLCDAVKTGKWHNDLIGQAIMYRFLTDIGFIEKVSDDFDKLTEAAKLNILDAIASKDKMRIKDARQVGEFIDLINPDATLVSIAERKAITDKLTEITAMEWDDVVEYMGMIKGYLDQYIEENNLKPDEEV